MGKRNKPPRVFPRPGTRNLYTRIYAEGRSHDVSTGTSDRAEAEKAAEEIHARAKLQPRITPDRAARGRLILLARHDVDARIAAGVSDFQQETTLRLWRNVLAFFGENRPAKDVTTDSLTAFIKSRREAKMRAQSIRKELQCLKRGLLHAKRKGWVRDLPDPWPSLKNDTKHETRRGRLVAPAAIRSVLERLPQEIRDEVELFVLTGMRRYELSRLKADWIRPVTGQRGIVAEIVLPDYATKNRRERAVGIGPRAMEIIRRRVEQCAGGPLFPDALKDRRSQMRKACKEAGLSTVLHPRDMRHTYATLGAQGSGDAKAVSAAIGHADLEMTNAYVHETKERVLGVSASVEKLLEPKKPKR